MGMQWSGASILTFFDLSVILNITDHGVFLGRGWKACVLCVDALEHYLETAIGSYQYGLGRYECT